jgi:hypothetical protein
MPGENESQASNRKRKRGGSTEVRIPLVEGMPIRRGKVIALVAGPVQIGRETEHSFAIAPARRAEGVAGCHEREWPTALIPPGAQIPPPRARVDQLMTLAALARKPRPPSRGNRRTGSSRMT